MKLNKSMVFLALILFSHGADTFAYEYTFVNWTGRDVKIKLYYTFGELHKKAFYLVCQTDNGIVLLHLHQSD